MSLVTDTHCLLWYLRADSRLSLSSKEEFDRQEEEHRIYVPVVVLAELLYLHRKYGGPPFSETLDFIERNRQFEIYPFSHSVIRQIIPLVHFEMHDALIVGSALELKLPLMTADRDIIRSGLVQTLNP